ncbi:MAG: hypothetical protein E2O51_05460 [Gammaproteobacteria bacterium]|nr:MAG: hypothetical protein E2O51_05460 [Gammaproteobacteria bacterium]
MAEKQLLLTAVNIIAAPREALETLRLKPTVLLPLVAIIIVNIAVVFTYYSQVDLTWTLESSLQNASEDMTLRQREAASRAVENLSPMAVGSIAAVSGSLFLTLWFFLNAAYLAGVSLLTDDGFKLKHWFAMICWCALPIVFGYAASLANLFLSDATFLRPDRINPLSFSSLLDLDSAADSGMRQSVQSLDITTIWSMVLGVYAYQLWTQRNLFKSALIVLAPAILIFGSIWYFTSS